MRLRDVPLLRVWIVHHGEGTSRCLSLVSDLGSLELPFTLQSLDYTPKSVPMKRHTRYTNAQFATLSAPSATGGTRFRQRLCLC